MEPKDTGISQPARLLTRSDFDGLVCAVLLRHRGWVNQVVFVHPKDVQDGTVVVEPGDITANLPYQPTAQLAFDNHSSEILRRDGEAPRANHILDPTAPTVARLVYRHLGGVECFPSAWDDMMTAVDKTQTGAFGLDDILHPKGWELLSFLMDARTGLGRFRDFRISNYQLMNDLVDYCTRLHIDAILELPDVSERVDLYFEHEFLFQQQIHRCARVHGKLVVLDLREEEIIYAGNRFMVHALYPDCAVSLHVLWGRNRQNTVLAAGHSIFNHSSTLNIGELMLGYGGGGHAYAGTCQVANDQADRILGEAVELLNQPAPPSEKEGRFDE